MSVPAAALSPRALYGLQGFTGELVYSIFGSESEQEEETHSFLSHRAAYAGPLLCGWQHGLARCTASCQRCLLLLVLRAMWYDSHAAASLAPLVSHAVGARLWVGLSWLRVLPLLRPVPTVPKHPSEETEGGYQMLGICFSPSSVSSTGLAAVTEQTACGSWAAGMLWWILSALITNSQEASTVDRVV